jgi:transcriptional regulator with XRE-family HTH domain
MPQLNQKIAEIVKQELKDKGIKNAEFARTLGVLPQSVNNWLNRSGIPNAKLSDVANAIGVSIDYLLTGDNKSNINTVSFELLNIKDYQGSDLAKFDNIHDVFTVDRDWFVEVFKKQPTPSMKIVFAQCESMQPTFKAGDFLLVDTANTTINDGVYIFRVEIQLFIKRLQIMPGRITALSDNKKYESFDLPADAVIIAKVTDLWKHDTP